MVLGARTKVHSAIVIGTKCKAHVVMAKGAYCMVQRLTNKVEHLFSKSVSKMSFTNNIWIFQGWKVSEVKRFIQN